MARRGRNFGLRGRVESGVADQGDPSGGERCGASDKIEVIRPGDRVYFDPGEDHWHGAAPDRFMTHLAMQEVDESGSPVSWGEHISDEDYSAEPPSGT